MLLGVELGHLKKIGGISIDGTKIKANASKHAAVSYKRAGEMIAQLEQEIEELVRKAEDADSAPLDDGLVLPDEIKRREDRKAALERACRTMEERYEETRREKEREYAAKKAKRETERQAGKKPRGKDPQPPSETPPDDMQYNFTDEESRIMKAGNGKHYEQAYNAQAAVDTEGSMLIVGQYVTAHANDKQDFQWRRQVSIRQSGKSTRFAPIPAISAKRRCLKSRTMMVLWYTARWKSKAIIVPWKTC